MGDSYIILQVFHWVLLIFNAANLVKCLRYLTSSLLLCRQHKAKVVLFSMIYTSGLEKILVRYSLLPIPSSSFLLWELKVEFYFIRTWLSNTDLWLYNLGYYIRMKQELQLLKLWSLMPLLEDVQYNTEKFKATNQKNSCHTSDLVSYHWREVLHLDLRNLKKNNLKHGCMFVEESELSEWNRHFIFLFRSLCIQLCFF